MSDKVSDKMSDKLTDKDKAFLDKLVEQLKTDEYVTTATVSDIMEIPASTARRYMTKFCELGILYAKGRNKGKKYYLSRE